jgi:hypothetical protein
MPGLPIALASDEVMDERGNFDLFQRVDAGDNPFRLKVRAIGTLPFERTLFLDVDTYVVNDLSSGFQLLDRFDLAAAHTPVATTVDIPELRHIPEAFNEFNTGVVFCRRSESSIAFMHGWASEYDRLALRTDYDQPSFRSVAYSGVAQIIALSGDFNQRFDLFGHVDRPRILHGWATEELLRQLVEAIDTPGARVFTGGRLFDGHGKLRLDYRHARKLRQLRAAFLRRL